MSSNYCKVRKLTYTKDSQTSVTLKWLPPDPDDRPPIAKDLTYQVIALGYMVFLSDNPEASPPDFELLATLGSDSRQYQITGLEPNRWYIARVIPLIQSSPISTTQGSWGRPEDVWFQARKKVMSGPAVPSDVHRG